MNYYLHDGQNQLGPFSPEQLKERNINKETFVWAEGMNDWVQAKEIPELNDFLSKTPPPFRTTTDISEKPKVAISTAEKTGTWIGRNPKLSVVILLLVVTAGYLTYINNNNNYTGHTPTLYGSVETEKSPEELRMELQQKEKQNPINYLQEEITMRTNLIGEKVFEGTITNTASIATFKDVVVKISYISKTESVISEEKFTVYELIGPQKTISIKKVKTFAPSGTEKFGAVIISALPVE